MIAGRSALASLLIAWSACGQASVPDRPAWDEDVFPILQGSCNHCHGERVGTVENGKAVAPTTRFDICNMKPFRDAGIMPPGVGGAGDYPGLIISAAGIERSAGKSRPNMPPPPAAPLSDYEHDVLTRWAKRAVSVPEAACEKQTRNRDPRAILVSKELDGDELVLTLEVSDPDGDQVMGKVTTGAAAAVTITASGRRAYPFAGAAIDAAVKVTLLDGFGAPVEFDF